MTGKFLTAEWRHVAMRNYEVDPAVLVPHVRKGTELAVTVHLPERIA